MSKTKIINIAKDFSDTPGGKLSGKEFRTKLLEPTFKKNKECIKILLDNTFGYPPSFLKEAFGELTKTINKKEILKRLKFVSIEDSSLIKKIKEYIKERK